jgi:hypothetical protein
MRSSLAQLRRLLDREELLWALEPHRSRDTRSGEWIERLGHQRGPHYTLRISRLTGAHEQHRTGSVIEHEPRRVTD